MRAKPQKLMIYIEGGGQRTAQRGPLRQAFSRLFETVGLPVSKINIVMAGSRGEAVEDFLDAFPTSRQMTLLLIDAERPISGDTWTHIVDKTTKWQLPADATADQLHLMVEVMESWLLCDRSALTAYFGHGVTLGKLPGSAGKVEDIAKNDVLSGLKAATRNCSRGSYDKGRDSAELLKRLDPSLLMRTAPHFARLVEAIRQRM